MEAPPADAGDGDDLSDGLTAGLVGRGLDSTNLWCDVVETVLERGGKAA